MITKLCMKCQKEKKNKQTYKMTSPKKDANKARLQHNNIIINRVCSKLQLRTNVSIPNWSWNLLLEHKILVIVTMNYIFLWMLYFETCFYICKFCLCYILVCKFWRQWYECCCTMMTSFEREAKKIEIDIFLSLTQIDIFLSVLRVIQTDIFLLVLSSDTNWYLFVSKFIYHM